MGRDKTIRERQEQEAAAEVATVWRAGGPAKPVLDRALADGLNVSRIKTMARAVEATAPKPKRTRTRATMASLMLLGLLAACASDPLTNEQLAAMPGDTTVGYSCPLSGAVQRAQARADAGEALSDADRQALAGCQPITAEEELARQEHLASCHLLSGNCGPRED